MAALAAGGDEFFLWRVARHLAGQPRTRGTPPRRRTRRRRPGASNPSRSSPRRLFTLASGVYLAFSADVLDFLRHRREEGRGWVVAPLVLVVGVYLVALFNAQWIYRGWLEHEKASALAYVTKASK